MNPEPCDPLDPMHPILSKLEGGDRRSIGKANEVVAEVLADPTLFEVVFSGLFSDDPLVRMRVADASPMPLVLQTASRDVTPTNPRRARLRRTRQSQYTRAASGASASTMSTGVMRSGSGKTFDWPRKKEADAMNSAKHMRQRCLASRRAP